MNKILDIAAYLVVGVFFIVGLGSIAWLIYEAMSWYSLIFLAIMSSFFWALNRIDNIVSRS